MTKPAFPAPPDGLAAYLLDGHGGAAPLTPTQTSTWQPQQGLLWLHLDFTKPSHQQWLRNQRMLNDLAINALLADETRPRATVAGDALLIALRGVNLSPGADPEDMISIRIWMNQHCIVTSHKRKLLSVSDIIENLAAGHGPKDAPGFIISLADRLVWRMSDTIEQFEDRLIALEESAIEAKIRETRTELAQLRRQIIALRRYLAPQREALSRLSSESVAWMSDGNHQHMREIADRLVRYIEDLDALRERAMLTQEELNGQLSEQINSRMYILSILSAIFLPLGFLTGLLGINVGGIPGAESSGSFWIFLGILAAVVGLQLGLLRWKKWL